MDRLRAFWMKIKPRGGWQYFAIIMAGIFVGLFIYSFFASRAYSYLSDEPKTCVNCHLMAPYYATWMHGSHGQNTTCNDCHVPQDNVFNKYYFKAKDGLRHAAVFTVRGEAHSLQTIDASSAVIMDNCIRCHTQLNTEFVSTGRMGYKEVKEMKGKACWDCHRDVPHTRGRSETSTPNALVPMPESNLSGWLTNLVSKEQGE